MEESARIINKSKSIRGSIGGRAIAQQRMRGAAALMGAPRLYSPEPITIPGGLLKTSKNNRMQAAKAAERKESRAKRHEARAIGWNPDRSLRVLRLRDYEENGYPDWIDIDEATARS